MSLFYHCLLYCILHFVLHFVYAFEVKRSTVSVSEWNFFFYDTTGHSNPDRVGETTKASVTYFEESLVRFQYQESFKKEVRRSPWGELKEIINLGFYQKRDNVQ